MEGKVTEMVSIRGEFELEMDKDRKKPAVIEI